MTLEEAYALFDNLKAHPSGCVFFRGKHGTLPISSHNQININNIQCPANRVALERKLGRPIRPGYWALHRCDRPACINPEHLYEGTRADNTRDREERNPRSWEHLLYPEMRAKAAATRSAKKLACKRSEPPKVG